MEQILLPTTLEHSFFLVRGGARTLRGPYQFSSQGVTCLVAVVSFYYNIRGQGMQGACCPKLLVCTTLCMPPAFQKWKLGMPGAPL